MVTERVRATTCRSAKTNGCCSIPCARSSARTFLLPCGWLYAFVVTAAGTGRPLTGAIAMATFWLGTLPVMVSLGVGVQTLLGRLGPKVPALTCLMLIGVGTYTLVGRSHLNGVAMAQATAAARSPTDETPSCCKAEAQQ